MAKKDNPKRNKYVEIFPPLAVPCTGNLIESCDLAINIPTTKQPYVKTLQVSLLISSPALKVQLTHDMTLTY